MAVEAKRIYKISTKGSKYDNKEDVKSIVEELKSMNDLEEVTLSGNSFGVEACEALAEALKDKTKLKICNFGDIFTGRLRSEIPQSLTYFTDALVDKHLEVIDLSDNAFGPDGLRPVVPLISSVTTLHTIKVNNTGLGPNGGILLAEALMGAHKKNTQDQKQSSLRVLVCGRSRLENGSMAALAEALTAHKHLREICLPQDGIRPEGIVKLLDGLAQCPELEVIDLQDNTFTEFGSKALAKHFYVWDKLQRLNVGDCMLSARGARAVFDAMNAVGSKTLEYLNLQYNEIDEKGALYLATLLKKFPNLKSLELNGNCFPEDGAGADSIRDALEQMNKGDILGSLSDMEEEEEEEEEVEEEESETDELAKELAEM